MSAPNPSSQFAPDPAGGFRNPKGEWRPAYPVQYVPLFTWPMRLKALAKWVFGWPGYLGPFNLTMLAVAWLTWSFTAPDLARCTTFGFGWIAQIWLRNQVLLWLYYGAYHWWLYMRKGEGTRKKYDPAWPAKRSRLFLFGDQIFDNVFWTAGVAGLIWTGFEVLTMWLYANHYIPLLTWAAHPVWFVVWLLLIPFWREVHFYLIHRLLHWKPLYRHVHYLHHKNSNTNVWSGLAMHPLETLFYFSVVCVHWIVPSHPLHFLFDLQHAALAPANSHHGFEGPIVHDRVPTGSYFHYLHHRYFECNYGGGVAIPIDRWFGTFNDGLPEGCDAAAAPDQDRQHRASE